MPNKVKLNKTNLAKLTPIDGKQAVYWDEELPGFGVRVSPGKDADNETEYVYAFFCQGRSRGRSIKITVGRYPLFSPEAARKAAREYLSKMALGNDPRPEKERTRGASTFGQMMVGYADWLEQEGKLSARKVRNEIIKGIREPFRSTWNKQANKVTVDDCGDIITQLIDAGHPRQADKVRSYMKAAFNVAINANRNVRLNDSLRNARVSLNPCASIGKVRGSSNAKDRALTISEFRAYWRHVKALPEPRRSVLMLHTLTGGQRIEQMTRVTLQDIDRDAKSMRVIDRKGRRTEPREHIVPLLPEALACIDRLTGAGPFIFSCDGGVKPFGNTYMGDAVAAVEAAMSEAGELTGGHFTPGTIRATVETCLAMKPYRVSSETIGRLLSHGLGGVQNKHYQKYEFFDEKMEALEMLARLVEDQPEPGAQVLPFARMAKC